MRQPYPINLAKLPATSIAPQSRRLFLGQSPPLGRGRGQGGATGRPFYTHRPASRASHPRIRSGAGSLPRCGSRNASTLGGWTVGRTCRMSTAINILCQLCSSNRRIEKVFAGAKAPCFQVETRDRAGNARRLRKGFYEYMKNFTMITICAAKVRAAPVSFHTRCRCK
jgi:hypothetical protein